MPTVVGLKHVTSFGNMKDLILAVFCETCTTMFENHDMCQPTANFHQDFNVIDEELTPIRITPLSEHNCLSYYSEVKNWTKRHQLERLYQEPVFNIDQLSYQYIAKEYCILYKRMRHGFPDGELANAYTVRTNFAVIESVPGSGKNRIQLLFFLKLN